MREETWAQCDGCGRDLTRREAKMFAGSDIILCPTCAKRLGFVDDAGYVIPIDIRDARDARQTA